MAAFEKALGHFLVDPLPKQARLRDAQTVLEGIGFRPSRIQGSHHHFVSENGPRITMAVHKGQIEAAAVRDIARAIRHWQAQRNDNG